MDNLLKKMLPLAIASALLTQVAYADNLPADPCTGLLALVNRPSQSDSVCPVPVRQAVLESGMDYYSLGKNHAFLFPQAEFRLGLPRDIELFAALPNYISQNHSPSKGFATTEVGVKHRFFWNEKWVFSAETAAFLPAGSASFGSNGTGGLIAGLLEYEFNETWSMELALSLNTLTMPTNSGGQRYTTLNPFAIVTYQINDKSEFYLEFYGQSRTAAHQGAGFDADVGLLYLLKKNWEIDATAGHRISGIPIGYSNYIGFGTSFLFA